MFCKVLNKGKSRREKSKRLIREQPSKSLITRNWSVPSSLVFSRFRETWVKCLLLLPISNSKWQIKMSKVVVALFLHKLYYLKSLKAQSDLFKN